MSHGFAGDSLEWKPIELEGLKIHKDLIALPCLVDLFFPLTTDLATVNLWSCHIIGTTVYSRTKP
jgi:hypothetical protein